MLSLFVLAAILLAIWLWILWRRINDESFAANWSYVPLVSAIVCLIMATGLWLR